MQNGMSIYLCSAVQALHISPLIGSMYSTVGNTVSTDGWNTSRDEHPPIASWSASLYAWVRAGDRFYRCCQRLHDFRLRVCLGCRDFEQILKLGVGNGEAFQLLCDETLDLLW